MQPLHILMSFVLKKCVNVSLETNTSLGNILGENGVIPAPIFNFFFPTRMVLYYLRALYNKFKNYLDKNILKFNFDFFLRRLRHIFNWAPMFKNFYLIFFHHFTTTSNFSVQGPGFKIQHFDLFENQIFLSEPQSLKIFI